MFKKIMLMLVVIVAISGVAVAMAQHGSHHSNRDKDRHESKHESVHGHSGTEHDGGHDLHNEHATHGFFNGIHIPSDEMLEELGFSKSLIEKLYDLREKFEDQSTDLKKTLKRAERDLEKAHKDKDVQEKTLHTAIDRLYTAKSDLMKLHATAAVEAREVIGPKLYSKIHEAHDR